MVLDSLLLTRKLYLSPPPPLQSGADIPDHSMDASPKPTAATAGSDHLLLLNLDAFAHHERSLSATQVQPVQPSTRVLHADEVCSDSEHVPSVSSRDDQLAEFLAFKSRLDRIFVKAIVPYHPRKTRMHRNYFNRPRTVITKSQFSFHCLP